MIERQALASYIHQLLRCAQYADYAPNGIQVAGKLEIQRIATAVTADKNTIELAIAQEADALLVHHGYFWRGEPQILVGMKGERIRLLMQHHLNLLAYHLPLDAHPELGNNACLGQLFSFAEMNMHSVDGFENLLWSGRFPQPLRTDTLIELITQKLGRSPLYIQGRNKKQCVTVAWCSGGAQDYIEHAASLGADVYLSGEVSERTYYQARELGIDYVACGHHATERYGIQALGRHLAQKFDLTHCFIDSDNPI